LNIDLSKKQLGSEGIKIIAKALQSGNCLEGLSIDLSKNHLGDEGIKSIAQALKSGKCPAMLNIGLAYHGVGAEGAKAIAKAFQSGNGPVEFNINLSENANINEKLLDEIKYLVKKNKNYHELKALNRFASIREFFMSTQNIFPKELRIFIVF
jgi:hypothetical protein